MENALDKESSPEPVTVGRIRDRFNPEEMYRQRSPTSADRDEEKENLIQAGNAKSLRSKFQNLDFNGERRERPRPRQITPPPDGELRRSSMNDQDAQEAMARKVKKAYNPDDLLGLVGRGHAKNTFAKFVFNFIISFHFLFLFKINADFYYSFNSSNINISKKSN